IPRYSAYVRRKLLTKVGPGSMSHSSFSIARRYFARIFVAASTSEMSIRARIRASWSVAPMSGITWLPRLLSTVPRPMSATPRSSPPEVDVATQSLARPAAVMAVGTALSRLTGLGRVVALAFALGVTESRLADAYNIANTLPVTLYELVLGGILTSIFVPVLVQELRTKDHDEA